MPTPRSTEAPRGPSFTRPVLALLAVASLAGAAAALYQLRPVQRQSIQGTLERLATALERRDPSAVRALVSPSYHDGRGLSRDGLVTGLLTYLDARGFSRVRVVGEVNVQLEEDPEPGADARGRARASAKVQLAQASPPPQGRADALRIELSLQHESDGWRVTSAEDFQIPADDLDHPPEE